MLIFMDINPKGNNTMLLIKTHLKETIGKGIGLFSSERIQVGRVWHKNESEFDKIYTRQFVEDKGLTDFFYKYASYNKLADSFYLCSDNARFVNHSENPNTFYNAEKGYCTAIRTIEIEEEITCDYREMCDDIKFNGFDFEVRET